MILKTVLTNILESLKIAWRLQLSTSFMNETNFVSFILAGKKTIINDYSKWLIV